MISIFLSVPSFLLYVCPSLAIPLYVCLSIYIHLLQSTERLQSVFSEPPSVISFTGPCNLRDILVSTSPKANETLNTGPLPCCTHICKTCSLVDSIDINCLSKIVRRYLIKCNIILCSRVEKTILNWEWLQHRSPIKTKNISQSVVNHINPPPPPSHPNNSIKNLQVIATSQNDFGRTNLDKELKYNSTILNDWIGLKQSDTDNKK